MKLIKKTKYKYNKTRNTISEYGLFLCPFCNKISEKRISNGRLQKSCGCMRKEFARQKAFIHGKTKTRLFSI